MPEKIETVQQIFEEICNYFKPEKAKGVNAVIQFNISGDGGGQWMMTVKDETCTVEAGKAEKPRTTFVAKDEDWLKIINGELNPMNAYMMGKIKVLGDMSIALRFQAMFSIV